MILIIQLIYLSFHNFKQILDNVKTVPADVIRKITFTNTLDSDNHVALYE